MSALEVVKGDRLKYTQFCNNCPDVCLMGGAGCFLEGAGCVPPTKEYLSNSRQRYN